METDGHEVSIDFEASPDGVLGLIDEVERTHRERDHAVGRSSDLDSDYGVRFWRNVILGHAAEGDVEISTLRLGGSLAAYVVSFLDGDCYRVFDGRFATDWSRYSPGRVLETETLDRAIKHDRYGLLDWMNSVAPDKLICANAVEETQHLVACSSERLIDVRRAPEEVIVLGDAQHRPTADAALRALAGVGRAAPRRENGQRPEPDGRARAATEASEERASRRARPDMRSAEEPVHVVELRLQPPGHVVVAYDGRRGAAALLAAFDRHRERFVQRVRLLLDVEGMHGDGEPAQLLVGAGRLREHQGCATAAHGDCLLGDEVHPVGDGVGDEHVADGVGSHGERQVLDEPQVRRAHARPARASH